MISTLRELWLFFRRDLSIARTYRTVFLFEAIEALFGVAMLFLTNACRTTPATPSTSS